MKIIGDNMDKAMATLIERCVKLLCTDISGKALLYFIPLFLTPFADKLGAGLLAGTWPSMPSVVGCIILGTIAGCIGLRAFYDGSYERRKSGSDAADLPIPKQPPAS